MTAPDDGVREIHLSGKQLVFLFMAVTVVSVVIFLCGVLVGRGVQAQAQANIVDGPMMTEAPPADDVGVPVPDPVPETPSTAAADVTFPDRLTRSEPAKEALVPRQEPARPASPPPAAVPAGAAPAAAATASPAPKTAAATPSPGVPTEPKGTGFAVQVAALNARDEAETMVRQLAGKGYAAYLVTPLAGQPVVFRVRVGKFRERAEAEKVAARLEREEQFKPWITR
jgi:cell division septation protein DedD